MKNVNELRKKKVLNIYILKNNIRIFINKNDYLKTIKSLSILMQISRRFQSLKNNYLKKQRVYSVSRSLNSPIWLYHYYNILIYEYKPEMTVGCFFLKTR